MLLVLIYEIQYFTISFVNSIMIFALDYKIVSIGDQVHNLSNKKSCNN